jgi:ATP/ADP translocase
MLGTRLAHLPNTAQTPPTPTRRAPHEQSLSQPRLPSTITPTPNTGRPRKVEPDEWPLLLLSGAFSFGAVALAIFIRTWSDTLFLSRFNADQIALFYVLSAVIFAPTTMGYAWLSQRFHPVRLNTATLLLFAGLSLTCLNPPSSNPLTFGLLLALSLVSPLVNALCWGMILERLTSRQSKRLVPLIGGSATLGAALSGVVAAGVIAWGGDVALMGLITATLLALSPLPMILMRGAQGEANPDSIQRQREPESLLSGLKALSKNDLLRVSAMATFLMAIATNLIDYLFKAELQVSLPQEQLGAFFARFHALTNMGVLAVQVLVLTPTLPRLGLRWSFGLYPLSLLAMGALCLTPIGLWAFIALRGADTLMKFTFYSTTENLLLTPVPFRERTQSKVFLKGVVYPLGGLVAGVLISILSWGVEGGERHTTAALTLTLLIAGGWVWSTAHVHQHYLKQLAHNLGLTLGAINLSRQEQQRARAELEGLLVPSAPTSSAQPSTEPLPQQSSFLGVSLTPIPDFTLSMSPHLFELIGRAVGRSGLGEQAWERWTSLSGPRRSDLAELFDQLCRREGIRGVGMLLERHERDL